MLDETKSQHFHSSQRQMQMQEEEADIQALVERERAIRQLEVIETKKDKTLNNLFIVCIFISSLI